MPPRGSHHATLMFACAVAALLSGVSATSAALCAQVPRGQISGLVTSSGGAPIAGAQIIVNGAPLGITNDLGEFGISPQMIGEIELSVRRLGFSPSAARVTLRGGQHLKGVNVALTPLSEMLNPVLISATASYTGRLTGYYQRLERHSNGYFLTRPEIDKKGYKNLSQLLRNVPGINAFPLRGGGATVRIRGRQCRPLVWLDGVPMPAGEVDLDAIPVSTLHGIEVYSASTITPQDFVLNSAPTCGTIAVWSRGRDTDPPLAARRKPPDSARLESAFTADQVDERAHLADARQLTVAYPPELRSNGVSGSVLLQFVVDERGVIESETFSVASSTHPLFVAAAVSALSKVSYAPALKSGKPVRQIVLQPFSFSPAAKTTSQLPR